MTAWQLSLVNHPNSIRPLQSAHYIAILSYALRNFQTFIYPLFLNQFTPGFQHNNLWFPSYKIIPNRKCPYLRFHFEILNQTHWNSLTYMAKRISESTVDYTHGWIFVIDNVTKSQQRYRQTERQTRRHGRQTDRQRCDSIGRTVLQTVAQKRLNRSICRLVVDSSGLKDARVESYSPGGANMPYREDTLLPLGECDWTIPLRWRCALCQITLITCYLWTRSLRQSHR